MIDTIVNISTVGAFTLAGVIAAIGINQSKKKDTDRFYECMEAMTYIKAELEDALSSYINDPTDIVVFNNLNTKYTAFVNHLDLFSAKILNQRLYKTVAFKNFQGESFYGLKDWALIQLQLFQLIEEVRFRDFGIISTSNTRKTYLKNTYMLLKITLPNNVFQELQGRCKEYGFL
ncbi:hypothetical protein ABZ756_01990 [Mammaliicoccus sciuri]